MAIKQQDFEQWLDDVAAGDASVREALQKSLGANETARERAVGGYLKEADYRHKTQLLAADRKQVESKLSEYESALQEAEGKMAKIMDDLAKERIDRATADARLQAVKERWNLGDDDMPTEREKQLTERIGKDVTKGANVDIDAKLEAFKSSLLKELQPSINRMTLDAAAMDTVWDDIRDEHRELFGKRLTGRDQVELMSEFQKLAAAKELPQGVTSLPAYWEHKYGVGAKRKESERKSLREEFRKEWEDEQTARRSKEMLEGVRGEESTVYQGEGSPLFGKKLKTFEDEPVDKQQEKQVERKPELVRSGADRAAERFINRRAAGVPLGAPDVKKTA
jgi:hypothetical protein